VKEGVVSNLRFNRQLFLESLEKIVKDLSQFNIEEDTSGCSYEALHVELDNTVDKYQNFGGTNAYLSNRTK
jgi:hypothetical protein